MSTDIISGLTEKQQAFIKHAARGYDLDEAARLAGYAEEPYPSKTPMRSLAVTAALHETVAKALVFDGPVNLNVLRSIRDDSKAPARVRADIAIKMLNMAGHIIPRSKDDRPQKLLSEMTRDEMVAFIDENQKKIEQAEDALASRARDVTNGPGVTVSVPTAQPTADKAMSFLD